MVKIVRRLKKTVNKSLATRISLIAGILVLIGIVSLSAFILRNIYTISYAQSVALASETSKSMANSAQLKLDISKTAVEGLLNTVQYAKKTGLLNREQIIDNMKLIVQKYPDIIGFEVICEQNAIDQKDKEYINKEGYDETGRFIPYVYKEDGKIKIHPAAGYAQPNLMDFYSVPQTKKVPILSEPYDDPLGIMVTLSVPILDDNGTFLGIVGCDVLIDSLQKDAVATRPMGGFSSIITYSGTYVANGENPKLLLKNIKDTDKNDVSIIDRIAKGEIFQETVTESGSGKKSLKTYYPITVAGIDSYHWSFCSTIPFDIIYGRYNQMQTILLLSIVVSVVLIIFFMFITINRGLLPIQIITEYLKKVAEADFSVPIPEKLLKREDELGVLAKSVSDMRESVRFIINHVINESSNVKKNVQSLEEFSYRLNKEIFDVSAVTEEVSTGMEETAASTEEINASSLDIKSGIHAIAEKAQQGYHSAKEISVRADELKNNAITSRKITMEVYDETNKNLKIAIEKSKAVEQINNLSKAILSITAQTNLLSLNAAIEAAKAGEAGKGFAVVAAEIRKLADESKNSANEIQNIAKTVISSVGNLKTSSEKILEFIDHQVIKDYDSIVETGEQYNRDAELITGIVMEFSETSENLLKSIEIMTEVISEVTTATNEGAEGISNIAGSTTIITQGCDEMKSQIMQLNSSAVSLIEIVSKFKV